MRTIPGTDTRFLVGGFVELDGLATRNKQTGPEQDTFLVSATPFGPADSNRRLSIRQSQVNWLSETPTELGTITTAAQVNLFSLDFDGKTKLSLWRLYAQLADVFVAGKTYSTFVDPDVLPTTLDFNGPSGSMAVQQWLARGIVPLGAGWTLAGSIEQSQADHRAGRRGIERSHERAPARYRRASALRLRARACAALRTLAQDRRDLDDTLRDDGAHVRRERPRDLGLARDLRRRFGRRVRTRPARGSDVTSTIR